MRQQCALFRLPETHIEDYLGGRPRDPHVRYCTFIPKGKVYPPRATTPSFNERWDRWAARHTVHVEQVVIDRAIAAADAEEAAERAAYTEIPEGTELLLNSGQ